MLFVGGLLRSVEKPENTLAAHLSLVHASDQRTSFLNRSAEVLGIMYRMAGTFRSRRQTCAPYGG